MPFRMASGALECFTYRRTMNSNRGPHEWLAIQEDVQQILCYTLMPRCQLFISHCRSHLGRATWAGAILAHA